MKFILILVAFNLSNPELPSLLAHHSFNSQAECVQAANSLPAAPPGIKAALFCVSEADLLERNAKNSS